jgi:hypothetical protein
VAAGERGRERDRERETERETRREGGRKARRGEAETHGGAQAPPKPNRAAQYTERVKRSAQEARWFAVALEGHEWREAAKGMQDFCHFMEAAYQKLVGACTAGAGSADEEQLEKLYSVLDIKFQWFEKHRRTCKQLEAEMTKRVKAEGGAQEPRPAPKAKGKGKAKAKGRAR